MRKHGCDCQKSSPVDIPHRSSSEIYDKEAVLDGSKLSNSTHALEETRMGCLGSEWPCTRVFVSNSNFCGLIDAFDSENGEALAQGAYPVATGPPDSIGRAQGYENQTEDVLKSLYMRIIAKLFKKGIFHALMVMCFAMCCISVLGTGFCQRTLKNRRFLVSHLVSMTKGGGSMG